MIAANSVSSGVFGVAPPCGRTRSSGINGLASYQRPSGTIQLHEPRPMNEPTSDHHIGPLSSPSSHLPPSQRPGRPQPEQQLRLVTHRPCLGCAETLFVMAHQFSDRRQDRGLPGPGCRDLLRIQVLPHQPRRPVRIAAGDDLVRCDDEIDPEVSSGRRIRDPSSRRPCRCVPPRG